ncbi:nucleotide exchange factor SIL1-like [Ruditapes philippinarum]|uniref:nucleotide exchange factor SIL1-like n=1 Tax=Ruditapes philippinarum TaxID=129788 RepID=UPI00295AF157|nr:nucleotide exchange factor SIL1-like [Ruditapes philippinarum]
MSKRIFHLVQAMNTVTVISFVIFCLHVCSHHGLAESESAALTIVQQEDENGVTVEEEKGEDQPDKVVSNDDPFHPTHEWQAVKEGQAIPAGLHVRMNLETGSREAKLMDGENEFKYWQDGDRQGMMNMDKKQFSLEELKRALKDFKTTELDDTDLQREAEVKKKFKTYEELKKDFNDINMDIKTDGEIIEDMIGKLRDKDLERDNLLTTLTDLEYYLHQIDNAVLFKDMGGIPYILKIMNMTQDEDLQMEAAMVLGAATSSNPKVQIGALEEGALQLLIRLVSIHSSTGLRRKVMFCISTLCRHFPFAQKRFLELGGLSAIGKVFEESGTEKLRIKVVAFLNDLLVEKKVTEENLNSDKSSDLEKLKQYNSVPLLESMKEQGWCEKIPTLLQVSDHDSREHVLNAMKTLVNSCRNNFIQTSITLHSLRTEYIELALEEDDGDYFSNMVTLIDSLIQDIKRKEEL